MPDKKLLILNVESPDGLTNKNPAEEAYRTIHVVLEALRREQDSAFQTVLESIRRHDTLSRTLFGPLADLERSGFLNAALAHHREMDTIRQAALKFEAGFLLPQSTEAIRLIQDLQLNSLSETAARLAVDTNRSLQHAIEMMRTPWVDMQEQMRSLAGFAEIQGIGHLLGEMPTFEDSVAAALRVNLGDWRDPITWRPEIFTDLVARSEFYVGLGFNPDLTNFPLPAFEESLTIAGLTPLDFPPVLDRDPPAPSTDEEKGLARTNFAHDRLQRLERMLRKFIDEEMTKAFGPKWAKSRMPNGLYEKWLDKKQKAEAAGAEQRPLIEYADFTDYEALICRADNWRQLFAAFFNRIESVRESFQRLYPIRVDTMHARIITQDDELFLHVEVKRLVKGLKRTQ